MAVQPARCVPAVFWLQDIVLLRFSCLTEWRSWNLFWSYCKFIFEGEWNLLQCLQLNLFPPARGPEDRCSFSWMHNFPSHFLNFVNNFNDHSSLTWTAYSFTNFMRLSVLPFILITFEFQLCVSHRWCTFTVMRKTTFTICSVQICARHCAECFTKLCWTIPASPWDSTISFFFFFKQMR